MGTPCDAWHVRDSSILKNAHLTTIEEIQGCAPPPYSQIIKSSILKILKPKELSFPFLASIFLVEILLMLAHALLTPPY